MVSDATYRALLIKARRQLMLGSLESFVDCVFREKYKMRYIFGEHHLRIIDALTAVVRGDVRKLIINIAPRYGKTQLAVRLFISYCMALNPASKFIHLSYSSSLAQDSSEDIKDIIKSEYYQTMFPYVRIKYGSDKKCKWNTTEGGGLYAVSTLGQITGFGAGEVEDEDAEQNMDAFTAAFNPDKFAGAIIIDDPIKPEDALSDLVREQVNRRFETTIRSRVNSRKTPIIIIGQRVHERDLCGYLMDIEPDEWTVLSLPAIEFDEDGKERPLWEFKHTLEELHKIELASPFVFQTQYMQNPTPLEGLMYERLKTYDTLPVGKYIVKNYTDTADTGEDFHCSIDYAEFPATGEMYVLSVLFTDKSMEYTEAEQARQMTLDNVTLANIEGNNGGRGFSRAVEKNMREMGNVRTRIATFHQTGNKDVRIFTHSSEVQNLVHFPSDWSARWPLFHNAVVSFRKKGRNLHDDAPDALTGMVEKRTPAQRTTFSRT